MAGRGKDVGEELVKSLQNTKYSVDEKLEKTFINLFGKKTTVSSERKLEEEAQSSPEGSDTESSEEDQSGDDDEHDMDGESNDGKIKQKTELRGGRLRRKAIFKDEVGLIDAIEISLLDLIFRNASIIQNQNVSSCLNDLFYRLLCMGVCDAGLR